MKKYVLAAIPAALALTACSEGAETAGQETPATVSDDNDAADPDDDAAKPAAEEHGDDHPHEGEDADHTH